MRGIVGSRQINPSLASGNPNDVRYGEGQYISDTVPEPETGAWLSGVFREMPFLPERFSHSVELDVTGLPVVEGRQQFLLVRNTAPLGVGDRIMSHGTNLNALSESSVGQQER